MDATPQRLTTAEVRARRGQWTVGQLLALPATVDVETACSALDMGLSKGRQLVQRGAFPTRVIKVGDRYTVPTRPLLALLGVETGVAAAQSPAA